jgi:hypothetical protein
MVTISKQGKGFTAMRLLNAHISKIFIRTVLVLCLMVFWGQINQVDAQTFTQASIQGEYAFTSLNSGGGVGISGDAVPQEAAMGVMTADGSGNMTGKITWNMYDFLGQVPTSDRLILHDFPITGSYTVGADGFGTMTGQVDFDLDGSVDMEITGKIVITRARTITASAVGFCFIGDEPSTGGGLITIRFMKRDMMF